MLKLSMIAPLNKKAKSRLTLLYSSENIVYIEGLYIENDITKSAVYGTLNIESILELLGDLAAVLNGQQENSIISLDSDKDKEIVLSITRNEQKSRPSQDVYLLRLENIREANFIQFQENASKFYSILYFLENVFRRMS